MAYLAPENDDPNTPPSVTDYDRICERVEIAPETVNYPHSVIGRKIRIPMALRTPPSPCSLAELYEFFERTIKFKELIGAWSHSHVIEDWGANRSYYGPFCLSRSRECAGLTMWDELYAKHGGEAWAK